MIKYIYILFFSGFIFAQEINISSYLQQIDNGEVEKVKSILSELKRKYQESASLLYLEGAVTKEGEKAASIYNLIINKYPDSKYTEASYYRIYSYYYALGIYRKANIYFEELKKRYPNTGFLAISELKNIISGSPAPAVNNKDSFYIQTGAFSSRTNAEKLKRIIMNGKYEATIVERQNGDKILFYVYAGNYKNEQDASADLPNINKIFGVSGKVVKRQ